MALAYGLAVALPTRAVGAVRRREFIAAFSVYVAVTTAANLDNLVLVVGSEGGRWSWPLVIATSGRLLSLAVGRRENWLGLYLWALVILVKTFASVTSPDLIPNVLRYLSTFSALGLLITVLPRPETRAAYAEKLGVLIAATAVHYLLEMLLPGSSVSVSSTRVEGIAGRAAGLYTNANNAGLAPVSMLLLICLLCLPSCSNRPRNVRLVTLGAFCGVAVVLTFSRQAMCCLVAPLIMMTWRMSGRNYCTTFVRFPFIMAGCVAVLVSVVEVMTLAGYELSDAARSRYLAMRNLVWSSGQSSSR